MARAHVITTAAVTALALALGLSLSTSSAGAADDPTPAVPNRAADLAHRAVTSTTEQLFVPLAPCRIADTRAAGGAMKKSQTRSFYVSGTTGFASQGGAASGCAVPASAKAVAVTVAALPVPTKKKPKKAKKPVSGSFRAWATGASQPAAVLLYYSGSPTTTSATLPLGSSTRPLTLKNAKGPTHVTIDVTGYYVPQLAAYISGSGTIIDQSGRLVSVTKTGTGTYTLVWDRDISTCSGTASSDISGYIESVYTSGRTSHVYVYNNAGTATDYWSNVVIVC